MTSWPQASKVKTQNSNIEENYFYFLCENEFTILDSEQIGSALNNYVIAYSKGNIIMKNISTFYGLIISKGNELNIENSNVFGAVYNESPAFNLNSNVVLNGSVVSKYSINILSESVSITKNNLPLFKNQSIGLDPFILPESYLEY